MNNYPEKKGRVTPPVPKMQAEGDSLTTKKEADMQCSWLERLADVFGVQDKDAVALHLAEFTTANCKSTAENCSTINALIGNLASINPEDPVESMLAMQMITCHRKALGMMEQANNAGLPFDNELWTRSLSLADKLMRTYTRQVETLTRYRRKGEQKVRVERVTVNEGGQAFVGHMSKGGGGGVD